MLPEQGGERITIASDCGGEKTSIWIVADIRHPLKPHGVRAELGSLISEPDVRFPPIADINRLKALA